MSSFIPNKLTQLGGGIEPISSTSPFSDKSNTNTGALTNMEGFVSYIISLITVVGSLIFIVNFLLAALNWISAGGDAGKIQKARDQMIQSTLGLVVVVGAYGAVGLIGKLVGLDLLNPATVISNILGL